MILGSQVHHINHAITGCWQILSFKILTQAINMMMSSNDNIFRVTGLLCGEFTGHRWIPCTKVSEAELWSFLWSAPEATVEQTMGTPVIWDAIVLIMTSLLWKWVMGGFFGFFLVQIYGLPFQLHRRIQYCITLGWAMVRLTVLYMTVYTGNQLIHSKEIWMKF